MASSPHKQAVRQGEKGYALLLVLFFMALLALGTVALAPQVLTQNQREKEEEMIWRGKQYSRGVKLYFQKTRHFPYSIDDLTTPKMGIRFMRRAYKDPMNTVDGSWRLIYIGAGGQPIGSLKTTVIGTPSNPFGSPVSGQNASATVLDTNSVSPDGSATSPEPKSAPPTDDSANFYGVAGNAVIGVGSKVDRKSLRVYDKAKNYRQFEFTWLPGQDVNGPTTLGASQGIGTTIDQDFSAGATAPTFSPPGRAPVQTGSPDSGPPPGSQH